MAAELRCFWAAKDGNSADEYEDAFCVAIAREQQRCRPNTCPPLPPNWNAGESLRLAIADGASEASFSAVWAKLLVKVFCRSLDARVPTLLASKSNSDASASDTVRGFDRASAIWSRCYEARSMPWYAEQKRDMGAYAAFLGLEIGPREYLQDGGQWAATAIGDSCMFQFRQGSLLTAFPIADADAFTQSPLLLSSCQSAAAQAVYLQHRQGEWKSGDEFLLLTDAAACWLLRSVDLRDADPLGCIRSLHSSVEFEEWVSVQRSDKSDDNPRLRNDDVTLLWYCISADDSQGVFR